LDEKSLERANVLAGALYDAIAEYRERRIYYGATYKEVNEEIDWAIEFINVHKEDI
jgi:hypothetical protein